MMLDDFRLSQIPRLAKMAVAALTSTPHSNACVDAVMAAVSVS